MIVPNKHTKIGLSLLYIAALILRKIKKKKTMEYHLLKKEVEKDLDVKLGDSFEYAICFLFLMNKIYYNSATDAFGEVV